MKKHRLSRILASISALAMTTCGVPFTTSAETLSKADYNVITDTDISLAMQTSIPRMLWTMKNKPDYLGFECPDNAVVGAKFTIADSEEGIFSDDNSIVYFPVSSNGEIIAIVSLLKNEGEVTTTVGKDFAKELSSALKDSESLCS